jgi:hypothetical protein
MLGSPADCQKPGEVPRNDADRFTSSSISVGCTSISDATTVAPRCDNHATSFDGRASHGCRTTFKISGPNTRIAFVSSLSTPCMGVDPRKKWLIVSSRPCFFAHTKHQRSSALFTSGRAHERRNRAPCKVDETGWWRDFVGTFSGFRMRTKSWFSSWTYHFSGCRTADLYVTGCDDLGKKVEGEPHRPNRKNNRHFKDQCHGP